MFYSSVTNTLSLKSPPPPIPNFFTLLYFLLASWVKHVYFVHPKPLLSMSVFLCVCLHCCAHIAVLTLLCSHCCAHIAVLTLLCSRCCAHVAVLTLLCSHCCAHIAVLTLLCSHCCAHVAVLTTTHSCPPIMSAIVRA
jgi:hypothetical protein